MGEGYLVITGPFGKKKTLLLQAGPRERDGII